MALGYKFQILPRAEVFYIYSTLKCTHNCTVYRGQQYMRNKWSVLCTEARTEGLRLQHICALLYVITRLRILCILHIAYVKEHHVYTYSGTQSCINSEICTSFTQLSIPTHAFKKLLHVSVYDHLQRVTMSSLKSLLF